jgi:hypothetical protein
VQLYGANVREEKKNIQLRTNDLLKKNSLLTYIRSYTIHQKLSPSSYICRCVVFFFLHFIENENARERKKHAFGDDDDVKMLNSTNNQNRRIFHEFSDEILSRRRRN